jgi:homocitrate synthase NifV
MVTTTSGSPPANALAAVLGGARGLDVTVNGLGDRAGNASLEQVAMALALRGFATGVVPERLCDASQLVAELSGVSVSKLAPVVGEFVFAHRSPGHLEVPLSEFEAFAARAGRACATHRRHGCAGSEPAGGQAMKVLLFNPHREAACKRTGASSYR